MRISLLLFLFFYTGSAIYAQDSTTSTQPFGIFLMPCQVLPVGYSGGFTIGTEFSIYRRFSLSLEGGTFYTGGIMAKADLKYYVRQVTFEKREKINYYFALEYAYKSQSYVVQDNYYDSSHSQPAAAVNYSVSKFANTMNIKFGSLVTRINSKHLNSFYLDYYFGLGLRYKAVSNDLSPGEDQNLYHWNEGFIDAATNSNYVGYTLSISAGLKIGYRFK
jgi:hypothetical protein